MTKRHQQSRRRSYGRRQHEIHERIGRLVAVMDWRDEAGEAPNSVPTHIWDRLEPASAGFGATHQRRTF